MFRFKFESFSTKKYKLNNTAKNPEMSMQSLQLQGRWQTLFLRFFLLSHAVLRLGGKRVRLARAEQ